MNIQNLSKRYKVMKIDESDIPMVIRLCNKNIKYYYHYPPMEDEKSIKKAIQALPPNKTYDDKFFLGFWEGESLIAVLDLVLSYPDKKTAFIGFFMMEVDFQGRGIGTQIIEEICESLSRRFSFIRLGYVKENEQSQYFWFKNGFKATGIESENDGIKIVVLQKQIK